MPYLLLLIVVAIIGFAVVKQLQEPEHPPEPATTASEQELPVVPTRPQDIKQFEQDINTLLQDSARDQLKNVDEITQ